MIAKKLDGRMESRRLLHQLAQRVRKIKKPITLATILVGERYDSSLYVRLKQQAAAEVGIRTKPIQLPESVSAARLLDEIHKLNRNPHIHGILLQLPLPNGIDADGIIQAIDPKKDVDGFHPANDLIIPPPVAAVEHFLSMARPKRKARVAILGKASVFARQLEQRFTARGWTIDIVQSHWAAITKKADVIITVLGRGPRLTAAQVKRGVIVVDVGIRKLNGKTVGDANPSVWNKAQAITPVPGGVGPMTIYYVLANTLTLATKK